MNFDRLKAYERIEERRVEDLKSQGFILRHKKTGAKIALLSNEDENKVFYIGFRTPPTDSTGVAHIIEHSVLCGSDKYPVKDPFVELAKGSLNTFLNAITYPDKTVYPVASCNDKDFANLMDVYLDAVFHPNIYKEKKIFQQEGWHYECESPEAEITYNGVVYNEMKGAYSSADDLLDRNVYNGLYPDTAYGVDSGGAPECIPDLTYEDFIAFHQKYYHPSNSYIYLYGNMDMEEKLIYLDEEYLSKYEFLDVDSQIGMQKPFEKARRLEKEYPVLETEDTDTAAYFSYNVSVGTCLDKELYVALQVLDYALCSAPGAPVKVALLDAGIGEDVYSVCENGILQPFFSFVAKNAKAEDGERFIAVLEETLNKLVQDGIPKKALLASLNYFEFKYREADFGAYPKGLMYGLQALDSWLYDANAPFLHIEANDTFAVLRQKAETGYFEKLVKEQILDNTHKLILSMLPVVGLEEKKNKELAKQLAEFKKSLTESQLAQIIEDTEALAQYQEEESAPEDMAKIPMLSRADLKKEASGFCTVEKDCAGGKLLYHPVETNGVSYVRLAFDARDLHAELLPYLGLLKNVLGLVNTEKYAYGDLFNEIHLNTGGISFQVNSYTNSKNTEEFKLLFEVKGKAFEKQTPQLFDLISEMLFASDLTDEKRLKEILGELKSRLQARMSSAGHSLAAMRAMSYFAPQVWADDQMGGVSFYRFVSDLLADFDNKKQECIEKLQEVLAFLNHRGRMIYDFTGSEAGLSVLMQSAETFSAHLDAADNAGEPFEMQLSKKQEGFCTSAGIQYVCRAGDYRKAGLDYTGVLRVLRVLMGYEYLWLQVRVKGGAYGCMSSFTKAGASYFVSYRDPNLEQTVDVYEKAPEYLRSFSADEDTMTKYIIGTIAEKDMPLSPSSEGARSFAAYMTGYTFEEEQKERDEILACSEEDIRRMADYVEAMLSENAFCVVGNEAKIKENGEMFGEILPLF
ncbi:MAG: insulinase family protein [Lachnospiraceae bacterium]|nr:insulinase family protein [Lachnospiraceae bacterium]